MYRIVEEKIKEAVDNGEFDHLPGMGKPLNRREDFQGLSPEIRRAYRILKNAGYIPDDIDQKNVKFNDLLHYATDGKVKEDIIKRNEFQAFVQKKNLHRNSTFSTYAKRIFRKFQSHTDK